ncbi:hypothetical protein NDN08_008123 [Rhodosorus marinus]|uniref:PD-(D/E)XK endonuclease-like domain-containing protein n=1 Tax=Rhodosorus marinus TaxID=101924 RepID=A0AAV8V2B3_9RHOD|nr:hypothetical protein NDN08_008123 [Rhodosorus marinus]
MPEKPLFRLAPSDFAFLWKECKRCFYLKGHGLLYRPRAPFPSIFNKIDLGMKEFFKGKRTESVLPDMPLGEFLCEEDDAWVESEIFDIDCLVLNDDQTYSIIDFKTSEISRYLSLYSRQLHAYGMALEFPSKKSEIMQGVVKHMGLVCYQPQSFGFSKSGVKKSPENKKGTPATASLTGICQYHEVEKNFPEFFLYLTEVVEVLEGEIPDPDPDCSHCNYLRQAERDGYSKLS